MDSFRRYSQRYRIPVALYSDRHGTYKNNNKKLSIEEQLNGMTADTQFSRALKQLSVDIIYAFSPQAKGRVERNFQTVQDRLVKELKRYKISSIKDANAFLDSNFLKDYNRRFAIAPARHTDLHRGALPVSKLNQILCVQEKRAVDKDFTVRINNNILQLTEPTIAKHVMVHQSCNGVLSIFHKDKFLKSKNVTHKFLKPNNKLNKMKSAFTPVVDPVTLKEQPGTYAA